MKKRRVSIVLFHDGKENILLQNRKKINKKGSRDYGFFGGEIKETETIEEALLREIKEELGISLENLKHFKTNKEIKEELGIELERNMFLAPLPDLEKLNVQEGELFLTTFKNGFNLNMTQGDMELLKEIYEKTKCS